MFPTNDPSAAASGAGTFRADLLASVVVFLVALPLCMGIAIASGTPVAAGLITGIIGGIVVGALAGCPLQVSGPAAGLTVIVFEIVERLGLEILGLVVIVAGLVQLSAGIGRLGQWFRAVSPAVIKGMLAGIGFLILGGQFHVMLDEKPPGGGARNLQDIPAAVSRAIGRANFSGISTWPAKRDALQELRGLLLEQQQICLDANDQDADRTVLTAQQWQLAERVRKWAVSVESIAQPELTAAARQAAESFAAAVERLETVGESPDEACGAAADALIRVQHILKHPELAGGLGLLTIVVILLWQELAPRRLKVFPPALIAVIVTSVTAGLLFLPVYYVDVPARLWDDIHWPTWNLIREAPWPLVLQYGLLTGIVASAETLLSAAAVDQMQTGPRTRFDQELMAHGIGNMLCGLVGALPMTGVIVRSSANVQAGARTRRSTMLHGLWLLVCVAGLASLLRQIPTSCLAAILVYTGYKLVDIKAVRELRNYGWGEVAIYATTIAVIVFEDLLAGVIVGVILSAAKIFYTFSRLQCVLRTDSATRTARLELQGAATFVRLPTLAAQLERVPTGYELHVDFSRLDFIDHACLDLLMSWGAGQKAAGGALILDWESLHGRFRRDTPEAKPSQVDGP